MNTWIPKRILFLLLNQVGKGTYWRGYGFAQELANRGHDVVLVVASPKRMRGVVQEHVGRVLRVEMPSIYAGSGYDPWDLLNRIHWLRKRPFDIIHAFETRPVNIYPALSAYKSTNGVLFTDWCDWFGRGGSVEERANPLLRNVLRPIETYYEEHFRARASGTTVINNVLKEKAINLGIPDDKLLYLPNGVDINAIVPQEKSLVRDRLGLSLDAPILAYTGSIFREDARLLAQVFARVHQEFPNAKLLLIGYNNIALESWIPELASSVIRTGTVSFQQLGDYVAAADIGLLPLVNSGANQGRFPMKLFDFMSAERPVVVTDVGDLGDMVRDKKAGLVAPDETEALATAVVSLLKDTTAQQEMGRNGRISTENDFSWPIVTEHLDAFYEQILTTS